MKVTSAISVDREIHSITFWRTLSGFSPCTMLFLFLFATCHIASAQIALPAYQYVTTVAGAQDSYGFSGDGGLATNALLRAPDGVAVDASGNLYIADTFNNRIRKVTAATGIITTIAGNGTRGYSGDGGEATSAELYYPTGVALDAGGNLYIADTANNRIRKLNLSSDVITTVAGNGTQGYSGDNGLATDAELDTSCLILQDLYPADSGIAVDALGNIYFADICNQRVREVAASTGIITTIAGTAKAGYNGDYIAATTAELNTPEGIALDLYGDIYIADMGNERIREVSAGTGEITTVAGTGVVGYAGDGGPAILAEFYDPSGIAVDATGNLYIADTYNMRIRKVAAGTITTVAGNGTYGYSGDGGLATSAELEDPEGVGVDKNGNFYVAENSRIRAVGGALTASTFSPSYKVVSILYSPPGNESSQGFGTTTTNGTTTTIGSSFSWSQQVSASLGLKSVLSAGGSTGTSWSESNSEAFTQSFSNTTTLTSGDNSSGSFNPTASDDINHNLDTFEIWLNPLVTVESNGTTPVSYSVTSQSTTVNAVPVPYANIVGVPAIAMEASPAGITALNPAGTAGVTNVPEDILAPIRLPQDSNVDAYLPGLGAICANNTLYQEELAADLAAEAAGENRSDTYCTQGNQCGCAPSDFAAILQTDPLLNYSSATYTANPYDGTVSPLDADSLATSSGPGSGPATCGLNTIPADANCRYVVVPEVGTNSGSGNAVPLTEYLEGGIQSPGVSVSDATTTAETIGGSTGYSTSVSVGSPVLFNLKVQDTWMWTDSESVGNSYGTANSTMLTLKSGNEDCDEYASVFEDTVYHTFAFQIPAGNPDCNPPSYSIAIEASDGEPLTGTPKIEPGGTISLDVVVSPLYDFTGAVVLSTANFPAGISATWSTTTIDTAGTATLTLTASSGNSTYIGNATGTVIGTSGGMNVSASFPFAVNQTTPTISISDIPSSAVEGNEFAVTYSYSGYGSPTETVASSTTGVCTVSGNIVSFVGVGTCTLTASATATADYTAVTGNAQTFSVIAPTISISNIPSSAVLGGDFTATYSYTGNGSPTESVSSSTTGVCTVTGSTVNYVGDGTCTLIPSATATADDPAVTGSSQSFTVNGGTFTLSPPSSHYVSIWVGGPATTFPITITTSGAFTAPDGVALEVTSTLPTGVSISIPPCWPADTPASGSTCDPTVIATATALGGEYSITITGTGGGITASTTFTLYVNNFNISVSPASLSVAQGSSGTSTITNTIPGSYPGSTTVSLAASGQPAGVTISFSPTALAPYSGSTSTMTVTVASTTTPGTYPITVTGTADGSLTQTTTVSLTVP